MSSVDLRRKSPTFGKWFGVKLSAKNKKQVWIPQGLAHGFLVLSDAAEVFYKVTDYYAPQHERTLIWNDSGIEIAWPADDIRRSCPPRISWAFRLEKQRSLCEAARHWSRRSSWLGTAA